MVIKCTVLIGFLFFAYGASAKTPKTTQVKISWTYQNFPGQIDLYEPSSSFRGKFISETREVAALKDAPVGKKIAGDLKAKRNASTSAVLVVENKSEQDLYFFAVPHVLHPHHASAGHYFECLCVHKVYRVRPGKIWYRIVRVNLNSSFQDLATFEINHQIIGLSKTQALNEYKDQLFEKE